jgi:glycosyltransferase involved in cell wall biosynthesis
MVGPGPGGAGGIAVVIDTLFDSPLAARYRLVRVSTHRDAGKIGKTLEALSGLVRAASILVRRNADVVYLHASSGPSLVRKASVAWVARATRTPYIVHVHAGDFDLYVERASHFERWLILRTLGGAAVVATLSPTWERRLSGLGARRTVVIPNPVAIPDVRAALDTSPPQILSLGRLGEQKGSLTLIRALALLDGPYSATRLVLAGDGDPAALRREARRLGVDERVELPGWIGPGERARRLREASAFALPSREEGLPIALLEAMAHGLPSVVTPVGGIPDIFEDGNDGYLVAPGDAEAVADRIRRILGDREAARRMGAHARRSAEERFSTEVVADLVADAIEDALASRGARRAQPTEAPR